MDYLIFLATANCFIAKTSSEARPRLYGPFNSTTQFRCAQACRCAFDRKVNDCSSIPSDMPYLNCLAYSFDFTTLMCALLGDTIDNMCAVPVTIYELVGCESTACGPITFDSKVICDGVNGYTCPSGFLPYIASRSPYYYGSSHFSWNTSESSFMAHPSPSSLNPRRMTNYFAGPSNITCLPDKTPTYPACTGLVQFMLGAQRLGDTYACLPGFTNLEIRTVKGYPTPFMTGTPVCTPGGWAPAPGGAILEFDNVGCEIIR